VTNWPAAGWQLHDVVPDLQIAISRTTPSLDDALDAEVERLWETAQARLGGTLFNGRVFSTDSIRTNLLTGHWTEYRRVVAQLERPELFDQLALRPTATGGVLLCADGVVFGRRPRHAIYQGNLWQLPPAGSLDPSAARADGSVDALAQIFTELEEEMGLTRDAIASTRLLCLAEHHGSHVLDLGILLRTTLREQDIRATHAARGNAEYAELRIVREADLATAVSRMGNTLTIQARAFLDSAGMVPGAWAAATGALSST